MQFILTILMTVVFGFSLLECQKDSSGKLETAKTNKPTAAATASTNNQAVNNNEAANAAPAATPEEAPRISLADAKKDFDAGRAVFVDTRAEVSYKTEHIKGAINIPAEAFQTRYTEVPKGKKIIAYCS